MTDLTTSIFGKRALGGISAEDYADWAGEMLVQGYDSPNLRIVAGLDRRGSVFETEDYFLRCIKELGIVVPEARDAVVAYACEIARQIIDGQLPPKDGVRALYQICLSTEYDSDFVVWLGLDDELDSLLATGFPISDQLATWEDFDAMVKQEAERFIAEMKQKSSA